MTVINSVAIVDAHTQAGGGRYVVERHTDSTGRVHQLPPYLAAAGFDTSARLASRAVELAAQLAEAEVETTTASAAMNLQHQTAAEFAARFWARVQAVRDARDQPTYTRLLWWLTQRLVAGHITDTQARNSFNTAFGRTLNATQWTSLRATRITPAHDRWAAVLAEGDL